MHGIANRIKIGAEFKKWVFFSNSGKFELGVQ
jgi:hypothetical protein